MGKAEEEAIHAAEAKIKARSWSGVTVAGEPAALHNHLL